MSTTAVALSLGGLAVAAYLLIALPPRWIQRHNEKRTRELTCDLVAEKEHRPKAKS